MDVFGILYSGTNLCGFAHDIAHMNIYYEIALTTTKKIIENALKLSGTWNTNYSSN